ncbi:PREDICTED: uncharacterized protein LOC105459711 [Wasmannia auropunctata]|uniref:uncharacterized protein LOC105459711 n=1 Tax=Wasmannia auropunctata TaxID=64793 RepID=UPI0005F094E4|nr:PREDICTED: uncharacterized protein LOC105459711 [Wasmannia auropunctata]
MIYDNMIIISNAKQRARVREARNKRIKKRSCKRTNNLARHCRSIRGGSRSFSTSAKSQRNRNDPNSHIHYRTLILFATARQEDRTFTRVPKLIKRKTFQFDSCRRYKYASTEKQGQS